MSDNRIQCPKCYEEMHCVGHGDNFLLVDKAYFSGAVYYYSCKFCGHGGERGIKEHLLKPKIIKIIKIGEIEINKNGLNN